MTFFNQKEYYKKYYEENKDKLNEYHNNYYYDHLGYFRNYYIENKEKFIERSKKRYHDIKYNTLPKNAKNTKSKPSYLQAKKKRIELELKKNQERINKYKSENFVSDL